MHPYVYIRILSQTDIGYVGDPTEVGIIWQ